MMRIMELAREALVSGHLISKRYVKYGPTDNISLTKRLGTSTTRIPTFSRVKVTLMNWSTILHLRLESVATPYTLCACFPCIQW